MSFRTRWVAMAAALLVPAFAGLTVPAVRGQTPPATLGTAPLHFDNLDQALARIARPENQTPLLVVDAANTRPAHLRQVGVTVITGASTTSTTEPARPPEPFPPSLVRPGNTLALRDVAAFFDRKIVLTGSVSVLAPTTMVVLNPRPNKPDLFAGLSQTDKLRMLLATLSPAQWRRLGGANGLGANDLTAPAQRSLFSSVLPDPFRFQRFFVTPPPGADDPEYGPAHADYGPSRATRTTLSPGQRASVRLVLVRRVTLFVPVPGRPGEPNAQAFSTVQTWLAPGAGTDSFLQTVPVFTPPSLFRGTRTEAYRVLLRQEVPARAKPGDLAFDAAGLNAPVSLAGKTVNELVRRAGQACRLELRADARLGALPVTVLGGGGGAQSVRAGDLLRALSLAVTGTFRRVSAGGETVFVLTDDVIGLGTRQARLDAWVRTAQEETLGQMAEQKRRIAAEQPDQYLDFARDDPHALSAGAQEKIAAARQKRWSFSGVGASINVADLAPVDQQLVREVQDRAASGGGGADFTLGGSDRKIGPGQVGVRVSVLLAYRVPGAPGVVEEGTFLGWNGSVDSLWADSDDAAPAPDPDPAVAAMPAGRIDLASSATGTPRALVARPADPDQAIALVEEARRRGFNQFWLSLPDASSAADAESNALLAACLKAGTKNGVAVFAAVSLLRDDRQRVAPTGEPDNAAAAAPEAPPATIINADAASGGDDLDRNVLGETRGEEARREAAILAANTSEEWRRLLQQTFLRTGDLLRVDDPDVLSRLKKRLVALVATPGLAGLVLEDTAAPGYADPGGSLLANRYPRRNGFGYTPGLRLAFLRQASVDPLDLPAGSGSGEFDLPFFSAEKRSFASADALGAGGPNTVSNSPPAPMAWNAFRYARNRQFLHELCVALRAARPDLPLFLAERGETPVWFSRWEQNEALPFYSWAYSETGQPPAPPKQARKSSSFNLLRVAVDPLDKTRLSPWMMKDLVSSLKDWNGVVFDLRDGDALTLLRSAFVSSDPTVR